VAAAAGAPALHVTDATPRSQVTPIRDCGTHCQTCSLRKLCLPVAFTSDELKQFDTLVVHRTKLRRYQSLYHTGESFHALYAIRFGSLKTVLLAEDGREQVMGYHMLGEIIGFDGIGSDRHCVGAIALESTELCALPFKSIENLAQVIPALQRNIHQMMGTEITRDQNAMLMLGSMHAEERLASFLLNLADRYRHRGYSSTEYELRMSRAEIGSYLGLTLETVSRIFNRFHRERLIHVQGRAVKLLDTVALNRVIVYRDSNPP